MRVDRDTRRPALKKAATLMTADVTQLRLVVTVDDLDQALAFYRDALGLPVELDLAGDHGARVVILDAGRATLELSNRAQAELIDEVEVGRRVAPALRVAFQVADAAVTTDRLVAAGATLIAAPTPTPWNSLNSRLDAPGELQLTLFEELET
jgi:catechol 2,3-dioxygenase-like lactoylglutathione lyase family enzyme